MYSVVEIGGHQYKVKTGDVLDVQKLQAEEGKAVEFDKVLFVGGENVKVGKPVVEGAKVTAHVIKHGRDKKIIVFKRKKGLYKRKKGHRQQYTALLVTEVNDGSGNTDKIASDNKWATKFLGQK